MSRQFNDTTSYNGLVQGFEREIGAQLGDVSGSTQRLKEFTVDANEALDDFVALAIQASGTWQFDDSNHTDYPVMKTNLVSGQRDYSFTVDENSNLVLDVYKVAVLPSSGATLYKEIDPIDELDNRDNDIITESTSTGVPGAYGKLANGIFLDTPSSYNSTNGLKVYINREPSHFASSDTTKKPGIPGIFHPYVYLKPAMNYARRSSLASVPRIELEVAKMEQKILEYFSRREKDVRTVLSPEPIIYE